jgi:hypothetical protein
VFEDTAWNYTLHLGNLQYFTTFTWAGSDYRIILTVGVMRFHVDLYSGTVRRMTATYLFDIRVADLQRFAFDSVVYYLSQATPLVDAIQEPLPFGSIEQKGDSNEC